MVIGDDRLEEGQSRLVGPLSEMQFPQLAIDVESIGVGGQLEEQHTLVQTHCVGTQGLLKAEGGLIYAGLGYHHLEQVQ